ncbi:MAG: DUF4397 domain-containing protein [Anaerolineae bacterium]|nr:DUF4397 domain-containing protein [Anaerolineae bacterium]
MLLFSKFANRIFLVPLLALLMVTVVAACDSTVASPPQITVVVTLVPAEEALDDAVAGALTATAQQQIYATETALANQGVTLTPTATPTVTRTPLPPTATEYLSPTPTDTPTSTVSPTFAPLPSNTPDAEATRGNGRVRFLHAWRSSARVDSGVDVFIDDLPVARDVTFGQATNYQSVSASTVRVSIKPPVSEDQPATLPLASQTIDVPPGTSISVVIVELDEGPSLIPLAEDPSPLPSNQSRLNILQANSLLLRSNVIVPDADYTLVQEMSLGDTPGPYDLDSGQLPIWLYDSENPTQILTIIESIRLESRVNYLLVFVPPADDLDITDYLLFPGSVNHTEADVGMRLVNIAIDAGPLAVYVDGELLASRLAVGETTVSLPLSQQGANVRLENSSGDVVFDESLGPWPGAENDLDKIVLLSDAESTIDYPVHVVPLVIPEQPRVSLSRANVRLIHGLAGVTRTLDLEIRSTNPTVITNDFGVPQSQQADSSWSPVAQNVGFGTASDYAVRAPNVFDVRLILSGSTTAQASMNGLQLIPGGVYHFVALPAGEEQGVAKLLLLEPEVQISALGMVEADPALVQEQVEIALTASAPAVTTTPTSVNTSTPTISPVPTNTPAPSNTPMLAEPQIQVNPAPPNAVTGSFVLLAANFAPGTRYTIRLDERPENISGRVNDDGTVVRIVDLPIDLEPGAHTVRFCADCRLGGAQQESFAVIRVADPAQTATPTPGR